MEALWLLIMVALFATNSLDKAESVKVKLELKTFDEIFGEGWWDKDEAAEDLKMPEPTNFGQNVHHQIDRQNTQIGQSEPNSTDQNLPLTESDHSGQIEPNSTDQDTPITEFDHLGQIEPNSTDQNPPLTESDHSYNAKNGEEQNKITSNENIAEYERKQKFDQMKAKLTRDGYKNTYHHEIDETVAKELGLNFGTIYSWKKELGETKPNHKHSHSEKMQLIKQYYEIKDKDSKINDQNIAKMLKINACTLYRWKKQFKRQHFHQNSVDSVEKNDAANVQEIGNSNLESI
uniref:Transposase n=1 Tax=Globodera rostochiensis TaxID=31243 RepID=A0A914HS69_GLORO